MEKYTVIIPTRNRAETLAATLRTCLRQTYENFEIIVSDNCSEDDTHAVVERFCDSRIRYVKTPQRLSMTGNFEFALQHVDDGFVMFIGSDDGLMPDAVTYVNEIVERYNVLAVSCYQASYVWPNFGDTTVAGRFSFARPEHGIAIRYSSEWIKKTLAFESSYCFDLPNLYCGFVHKRIIEQARNGGAFFRSVTPDAYSAFASALFLERYAYSYRPFSIAGASSKSNGAAAMNPASDTKEVQMFLSENDIPLAHGFVNCPSFEVVCAEAFAKLAEVFPERCAAYKIDYRTMFLKALAGRNPKTWAQVTSAVEQMRENFECDRAPVAHPKRGQLLIRQARRISSIIMTLMFRSHKAIEVPHSEYFGIRDVDDAAMFAYTLYCLEKKRRSDVVTVGAIYRQRIGRALKFFCTRTVGLQQ
jgi:hypothetical protein